MLEHCAILFCVITLLRLHPSTPLSSLNGEVRLSLIADPPRRTGHYELLGFGRIHRGMLSVSAIRFHPFVDVSPTARPQVHFEPPCAEKLNRWTSGPRTRRSSSAKPRTTLRRQPSLHLLFRIHLPSRVQLPYCATVSALRIVRPEFAAPTFR